MNRKQLRAAGVRSANPSRDRSDETTPEAITPEILAFCRELGPAHEPVYLVPPPERVARTIHPVVRVQQEAAAQGCEVQYGWILWEFPHVLLTAEFHAVIRRDGQLHDITPTFEGERRLLFHPIERWDGGKVPPPVRKPLSSLGEKLVRAQDAVEGLQARYLAANGGAVVFAAPPEALQQLKVLHADLMRVRAQCVVASRALRSVH